VPNKEEEKKKTDLVIGCILALALLVRMIAINQSFWLDEAINVTAARDRGFTDLILNYTKGDFHPPLYHIILWLWLKAVPVSEMSARLPSVVFGVLTVWVVYKIGQKLWKENASFARLAALFLATSGLHVYYSQEARMYALAALTTASAVLTLLNLRKDSSRKNKLLFLSSFVLMLLSDYQPWLLLPFFFVVTPGMTALALFLLFPWWPMLAEQVRQGITTAANFPAWGEVVGGLTLKSALLVPVKFLVGRVSIDNNLLYALVLSLPTVVAGLGLARTLMEKGKHLHVIKGWLAVPLAAGALVGLKVPIFSYFRFLFVLPAFYLMLSYGLGKFRFIFRGPLIAILLLTNIISTAAYLGIARFHREDWRSAASFVFVFKDQSLVLFPNLAQAAGFEFYNNGKVKVEDPSTLNLHNNPKHVFLVKYVAEIFDPKDLLVETLNDNGYQKTEEKGFNGVLVWHYELKP